MNNIIAKNVHALTAYKNQHLAGTLPKEIIGYYNKEMTTKLSQILISYSEPKLPRVMLLNAVSGDGAIIATGQFADLGAGQITRCGFIVNALPSVDGAVFFESQTIPQVINLPFEVSITGAWNNAIYIAAFAENAAGIAVSEFLVKTAGWGGGKIYGIMPDAIAKIVVGGAGLEKSKIRSIHIGRTKL